MKVREQSNTVVRVPFHGDEIEAVQTEDGKIMVSLKRVCESLGVDPDTQRKKLLSCEWATTVIMTAVAEDGKQRQLTMIDHESLPMWLVTINAGKVKPEAREKLLLFQREAKAVLSAWFLGSSADAPELARELAEVKARLAASEEGFETLRSLSRTHYARLRLLTNPLAPGDGEHMTLRRYCDRFGVVNFFGGPMKGA